MRSSETELSAAEYRALVEHSPVMIWRSGLDARCDYFNETWLAFTGRTQAQEQGEGWLEGVHPDDLECCTETYLRSFRARQAFEMEYRLRRHDGVYRYILDRGVPYTDSVGAFLGFIGSCVDVHDRRELDASKALFLTMVAHELRTPLTSLKTYLEVMARRARPGALDPSMVDKVRSQLERFARLVQQLDAASAIALPSPVSPRLVEVDLRALVADVIDAVVTDRRSAGAVHHDIAFDPGPGEHRVAADPGQLRQALSHILDNAIKYSPDGGTIALRLRSVAGERVLEVEDQGIGVPPGELHRLGQRFYRASNAPPTNYPGLGLGLTLARLIVARHGGRLSIVSERGRGTTVSVTLPPSSGDGP